MALTIFIALAGLMGAAGIALAAASAHTAPGAGLDSAAYMLLFHAAALVGGAALIQQGVLWRSARSFARHIVSQMIAEWEGSAELAGDG